MGYKVGWFVLRFSSGFDKLSHRINGGMAGLIELSVFWAFRLRSTTKNTPLKHRLHEKFVHK